MMDSLPNLTAVSLFSGAGGMDVGFVDSGFRILFANDIDPFACETYERNHNAPIVEGPIEECLDQLPNDPDIDSVFGGPPCQGFSVAGKMDPGDPRSKLVWSYFDVLEKVRPKVFVCENVKALGALERWKDVRREMQRRATEAGYSSAIVILNAANFGVPQNGSECS